MTSRKPLYALAGYGLPMLITAVAIWVDRGGFGTSRHCWLRTDNFFVLAFVAPASLIVAVNVFFLALTLVVVCRHSMYRPCRHDGETVRNIRSWLKGAAALMCLLGSTWTLGLFWIDNGLFSHEALMVVQDLTL